LESGPGSLHFARDLPDDFFAQCVAERKVARYVKGKRRVEWTKGKAERNEALDLMVYALAMAEYLGLGRYNESDWDKVRQSLMQHHLFDDKTIPAETEEQETRTSREVTAYSNTAPIQPPKMAIAQSPVATQTQPMSVPPRRVSRSGYLKRR
jgi:phage terminase large subunit GpA-like protein